MRVRNAEEMMLDKIQEIGVEASNLVRELESRREDAQASAIVTQHLIDIARMALAGEGAAAKAKIEALPMYYRSMFR